MPASQCGTVRSGRDNVVARCNSGSGQFRARGLARYSWLSVPRWVYGSWTNVGGVSVAHAPGGSFIPWFDGVQTR